MTGQNAKAKTQNATRRAADTTGRAARESSSARDAWMAGLGGAMQGELRRRSDGARVLGVGAGDGWKALWSLARSGSRLALTKA